jgi:hypothetical protein
MEIQQISTKLPWKGSMGRRKLSDIKYVIVHHDASVAGDSYDAVHLYEQEANYHISKGWGHIGYSIRIARDGSVYQTVPYEEIGVHAGNYTFFKNSLGVCLDGDFSRQKPSVAQLNALRSLMEHLAHHSPELPGVVESSFYAHTEVRGVGFPGTKLFIPSGTFCPGKEVKDIVKSYRLTGK